MCTPNSRRVLTARRVFYFSLRTPRLQDRGMAQLPRIEFSHLHKPLRRVLGAMNYFERLLRDGRDEWERFQREHSDRTGKPKIAYEEEFNRRGEALVEAVDDATQIVKPLSGCLSTLRPGPLEYAGIRPTTSVSGWVLYRAGLFHEMYLSRTAQGAVDPEESSIEKIIDLYNLPEPYDQQYIERLLEEELCFNPHGDGDSAAENVADPSIAESGQPTMAVEPLPEFAYWPDGDGYFIRAFGVSGNLSAKTCIGLGQVYRIIQSAPETLLSFMEVKGMRADDRVIADQHSWQPTRDGRYRADVAKRIHELERLQHEAEKSGDPAKIAEMSLQPCSSGNRRMSVDSVAPGT